MINKRINISYFVLIFFKIRLLYAQVPNTSRNQGISLSSVQRFSDVGAMGFPNFGAGSGNPTSNYPTNSFSPFGNQNNNIQRPGYESGLQNSPNQGFQNQQGYPYEGDSMNPYPNYQRPQNEASMYPNQNLNQGYFQNRPSQGGFSNQGNYPYQGDSMNPYPGYQQPPNPNTPDDASILYSNQNPDQGNFQNRPSQGGFPYQNGYPYQGDSMNLYSNYQRPSYSNTPDDVSMNPGNFNRPYQNGGMLSNQNGNYNQQTPHEVDPGQTMQFPPQVSQYLPQGNFQGNPNLRPDGTNPNFRPNDINNFPTTNIQFPGNKRPYQDQPNQLYPDTSFSNQNNPNFSPNNQYPSNNIPNSNSIQFPGETSGINRVQPIQYPDTTNPGVSVTVIPSSPLIPGNSNNLPPNQGQLPNNQQINSVNDPNNNGTVAIMGKPVIIPPTSTSAGHVVFDDSTESPTQKKCVQDCQSTSEYDPICGTNNVTYINPGKFVCARNCGVAVYLQQKGRCEGDVAPFYEKQ